MGNLAIMKRLSTDHTAKALVRLLIPIDVSVPQGVRVRLTGAGV